MPRTARPSVDERRARLLALGLELFSKRAYDDVSTDDIASAAGVSKGLLYHYFSGKRGYYVATIRELARRVISVTELQPSVTLEDAVRTSLRSFVAFVRDNADFYRALLRGGVGSDDEAQPIIENVRQTISRRILSRAGVTEPDRRTQTAVYGWIGFIEATSLDWIAHGHDHDEDELIGVMMSSFVALVGVRLAQPN
ncbi:MAG: TetR/AcrR family transcriptional regulator [Nannocystaceae bacterium]|nr:TetR/AcrR family transcriptional regulator [Nannocystaceae bacterium]